MFTAPVCAYAKYIHMFRICIYLAYADGRHMDMSHLYIVLSFFRKDPKKVSSGSSGNAPPRNGPPTQHVVSFSADDEVYVVFRTLIVTCCPAADIAALLIH